MKNNRSWFALVTLCATTAVVVALGMAAFFASVTVASSLARTASPVTDDEVNREVVSERAGQEEAAAAGETFAGLITDDHCGARHDMGSDKSPAECARACVRNGAKFALVNGDKSYALEGTVEELSRRSGQRVTLTGSIEGNTIQVRSIAAE